MVYGVTAYNRSVYAAPPVGGLASFGQVGSVFYASLQRILAGALCLFLAACNVRNIMGLPMPAC
jgi:hypothetical protein